MIENILYPPPLAGGGRSLPSPSPDGDGKLRGGGGRPLPSAATIILRAHPTPPEHSPPTSSSGNPPTPPRCAAGGIVNGNPYKAGEKAKSFAARNPPEKAKPEWIPAFAGMTAAFAKENLND